jgi:hypothetical protein
MRTSRLILGFVAVTAAAVGCAKSESVPNSYGSYGGSGATNYGGAAGSSTGGTGNTGNSGGAGNSGNTGGTGNAGGTGGTGNSGNTGGTGNAGGTGGTGNMGGTGGTCTPPVSGGACDTSPQCGCASGQACVVVTASTGVTGCVAAGSVGAAQACSGSDCSAGYDCVGGACKKYCDTAADCSSGQDCEQVTYTDSSGNSANIPGMKVCSTGCNLVDPSTVCGSGLTCYQVSQTSSATDCGTAGTGTGTNGCSSTNPTGCAPGYLCVYDSSNNYSCAHWCRVGSTGDCTTGSCANLQTPVVINNVTYGICQ